MKREVKRSNTSISWHVDTAYILECSAVSIHALDSCRSSTFKDVECRCATDADESQTPKNPNAKSKLCYIGYQVSAYDTRIPTARRERMTPLGSPRAICDAENCVEFLTNKEWCCTGVYPSVVHK